LIGDCLIFLQNYKTFTSAAHRRSASALKQPAWDRGGLSARTLRV
jgi:hypothetical protein